LYEPEGYKEHWQKFENDVFLMTRRLLGDRFAVRWNKMVGNGLTPDVVVLQPWEDAEGPGEIPFLIIEAHDNLRTDNDEANREKDEQMMKYSEICDSILVTPSGFGNRLCVVRSSGKYRIIGFHALAVFLGCVKDELDVSTQEDITGDVPVFNLKPAYERFRLELRKNVDRCPNPNCKSKAFPVSLIYCSHWDVHFCTEHFDEELREIKGNVKIRVKTYSECEGCSWHDKHEFNYEECPYADLAFKYQCSKCGAVFEPESSNYVTNFEDSHAAFLRDEHDFYRRLWHSKT